MTIKQLAEKHNVSYRRLRGRLLAGWPLKRALEEPCNIFKKREPEPVKPRVFALKLWKDVPWKGNIECKRGFYG